MHLVESLFPSALDEGESRSKGIIELSKVLSVSTVAAWSRAVGRLLDISPSELYLRAAWRSIVTSNTTLSSTEDTRSNDMMIAVMESHIRECLARMRLSHRICLCMAISGVLSNPTNETLSLLDSSSLTFGEFNLSPPLTPSCPLPPLLALQLLTLIQDACLCQSTISASSSRAISSLSLTSSNVEAAETATFNLQIKSLLNWCELMISLPASLQAHCRDQLVYFSPSGLEDVIISALTHYEVDVEALLCKASLFLCVRCPTSYQLPPPLFLLQRSLSSIINNSESSIKKAVVDVSTIMGKALAVLSSSELKELFSFVRALLTTISPNSNSERLMRVRRLLRLAKLFSRLYDPEAALVVIWLQTLLLSSFSLSNLPLHEISITTDEDKVILFNRILQNMAEGDPKCESLLSPAPRFRLLVKLLRCWGFSSHSSVPMAFSHFASSSTVLTGLKTAKDLAPPLKLSFAAKHCWEGMFQQLHFIHEWTGSMNLFLLEVLVVDIGVFGWADYENKATEAAPLTDAYAYRNLSILENPTSLTSWLHTLPFLSKTTKTHISLLLGGSFATNVVSSLYTAADIDDDITLLLLPLTASPSQLMASTTVFAPIVRSYRDRLLLRYAPHLK